MSSQGFFVVFIYYSTYLGVNYIYRTVATWVVLLTFSRVIIDDCTGEINLPLRLRCVCWYYALNKPCGVFVGLWMMCGRDESAPTPTVCSLLYIYAMNKLCGVFVGLWMMYGRGESAPTVCSLIYIYAMNKPCCVFVGLWMIVRAR